MAKTQKSVPANAQAASGATTALAFGLITLLAGGAGAGHGLWTAKPESAAPQAAKAPAEPPGEAKAVEELMRELPPIVTTLVEPKNVWVRLQTAIVLDRAALPEADRLAREITSDILAFVRTLSLPQLQGASGLQHLREDLNERAAIRSKGRVRELVIQTMVLQ